MRRLKRLCAIAMTGVILFDASPASTIAYAKTADSLQALSSLMGASAGVTIDGVSYDGDPGSSVSLADVATGEAVSSDGRGSVASATVQGSAPSDAGENASAGADEAADVTAGSAEQGPATTTDSAGQSSATTADSAATTPRGRLRQRPHQRRRVRHRQPERPGRRHLRRRRHEPCGDYLLNLTLRPRLRGPAL